MISFDQWPECRPACFAVRGPVDPKTLGADADVTLDARAAEAVAALLPILGCGEEAASFAFDGLAVAMTSDLASYALNAIAAEERVHDALLKRLANALPSPDIAPGTLRAARRFHISLGQGGADLHLARIAAIDAATCTVLSRLLQAGGPISRDRAMRVTLSRIRSDEARHVSVSRRLALATGAIPAMRDAAAAARVALANVLMLGADAFEALSVDPDALARDLGTLPDGLLVA